MECQRRPLAWPGAAGDQSKDPGEGARQDQADFHAEFGKKICLTKHLWVQSGRFYLLLHVCQNFREHGESCTVEMDQMS